VYIVQESSRIQERLWNNSEGTVIKRILNDQELTRDDGVVMYVVDIDECSEQKVQCPSNQKCFNKRGGYECVDTSCPPNYDRDLNTG